MTDTDGAYSRFLLVFLAVSCSQPTAVVGLDIGPPELLSANVSGSVTLSCEQRDSRDGRVRWYHEDAAHYLSYNRDIDASLPADLAQRLEIIGDPNQEEFHLRINDLRPSDSGAYDCLFAPPRSLLKPIDLATLTVHVPPDAASPECGLELTGGAARSARVGDRATLRCDSTGDPPPFLAFGRGDSSAAVLANSSSGSLSAQTVLTAEDNGLDFVCTMTSPVLDGPRHCSVRALEIPPTVSLTPSRLNVTTGDGLSFECEGSAVPSVAEYRWVVRAARTGDELSPDRYVSAAGFLEIAALRENTTVTCVVSNINGLSASATVIIDVEDDAEDDQDAHPTESGVITSVTATTAITSTSREEIETMGTTMSTASSIFDGDDVHLSVIVIAAIALACIATVVVLVVLLCHFCRWRGRKGRRSKEAAGDFALMERGSAYSDQPTTSSSGDDRVQASLTARERSNTPVYAVPQKPKRGDLREPDAAAINRVRGNSRPTKSKFPHYAVPKKPRRMLGPIRRLSSKNRRPSQSKETPRYARPKKLSKRLKIRWGLDKNGYSVAKIGESPAYESTVVYAEIDVGRTSEAATDPPKINNEGNTVYAKIT